MTELNKDVDKLSSDLTIQSRSNTMYLMFNFFFVFILYYRIGQQEKQIVDEH
jgi:hypothetical protein